MGTLTATKYLPLVIDRTGAPIPLPTTVQTLIVKQATGGRPRHLGENGADLVFAADADMNDLIEATGNKPGRFLTYPRDADGRLLPQHGHVIVTPEHVGLGNESEPHELAMVPATLVLDHNVSMLNRMLSALESNLQVQQRTIEILSVQLREAIRNG